jgi:hypothetical protein
MIFYERELSRPDQTFGEPVWITHSKVRLTSTECAQCRYRD